MFFYVCFFIYLIFTVSDAKEKSAVQKTLDSYIAYVENNQPEGINTSVPSVINSLTTESYSHKKKRLIFQLYKNSLLKQREQREKDRKNTLIHRKRSADIEKFEDENAMQNATKIELMEAKKIVDDEATQNVSIIELYREIKKSAEGTIEKASPILLFREIKKSAEETTQRPSPILLSREIKKSAEEIITQLSRAIEKLGIKKTTQNAIITHLSGDIEKLGVGETTQSAFPIEWSRDIEKLEVKKTTQNAIITELSGDIEKIGVIKKTQNATSIESEKIYVPIKIARPKNDATENNPLRQLVLQTETAQDKSKKAWEDIRLRSANVSTTKKKSTFKTGRPYDTMKDMIRHKRRSLTERRSATA